MVRMERFKTSIATETIQEVSKVSILRYPLYRHITDVGEMYLCTVGLNTNEEAIKGPIDLFVKIIYHKSTSLYHLYYYAYGADNWIFLNTGSQINFVEDVFKAVHLRADAIDPYDEVREMTLEEFELQKVYF